jgi:ketosteroid isomerase-like protein
MSRLAVLLIVLLACAGSTAAHPPSILNQAAEKVVAEEVTEFRKALAAAIEKKDAVTLRTMYADTFVHTHGSGKVDGKDARIVAAVAGDPVIETAPVSDLVIRVPGGWTAIATGVSPIKSAADGNTYSFRWTAVYVRVGDGWQLAASQVTRLAEQK